MVNHSNSSRYAKVQRRHRRRLEAAELAGKLIQRRRQREAPRASSPKRARKPLTRLHIGEALSLTELRAPLRYNLDALRDLLDVMEHFENSRLDIVNTIHGLSRLFRDKPYLIQAFNIFLPEGHCLDDSLLPRYFDAASLRSSPAPLIIIESEDPSVDWTASPNDYVFRAKMLSNSSGHSEAGTSERISSSPRSSASTDYGHFYTRRGSMDSNEVFLSASPNTYFTDVLLQPPLTLPESGSNVELDEVVATIDLNDSITIISPITFIQPTNP